MMNKPDIIVTVEREGIELRRKGRDFWGLCPFHTEKTPSFKISPVKQVYYCFGCGEHGDVIAFIQKIHGLSFKDSLKYLGIENGKAPIVDRREQRKRELLRAFRTWERLHYRRLCDYYRFLNDLKAECDLFTESTVDAFWYAKVVSDLPVIEHQLDILLHGDDEDKFHLFKGSVAL
jgi:hypothetical protein